MKAWLHIESEAGWILRKARRMSSKANPTDASFWRRRNHGMDQAMKAGIAAAACSALILAIVLLVMSAVPV